MFCKNFWLLILGSTLIFLFNACKEKSVPIKVKRFERDLIQVSEAEKSSHYSVLRQEYPVFFEGYCRDILSLEAPAASDNYRNALKGYISYPGTLLLKQEVDSVFPDLNDFEQELGKAMFKYQEAFRSEPIPQFISFISEFSFAHVTYDNIVGIGLDFYLGQNYPLYKAPSIEFPDFMVKKLRKEYMLANTIKAFAISKFERQLTDKRLLAMMLFEGKLKYFVKSLAPNIHDTILFGYSAEQLKWCETNEAMIWQHIASNNMLFSKDATQYMRLINDGPFTIAEGVPQESAPSIAIYAGYRIIQQFVENEGIDSLKELMDNNKWDEILKRSNYKPLLN